MRKLNFLLTAAFLIICMSACSDFFNQTVEIEVPNHESRLAVTSQLNNVDTISLAFVTKSIGILDSSSTIIKDANVQLSVGNQSTKLIYDDLKIFNAPGFYIGEKLDVDGASESVTIEISAPGFPDIRASQSKPTSVKIDRWEVRPGRIDSSGNFIDNDIEIEFSDPGNEENFYGLQVAVERSFDGQTFTDDSFIELSDPLLMNVNDFNSNGIVFNDEAINGKKYTLNFKEGSVPYEGDESLRALIIRLVSKSRDSYLYAQTLSAYERSKDNPFAEPVVVHSNVEGGYGIFTLDLVDEIRYEF